MLNVEFVDLIAGDTVTYLTRTGQDQGVVSSTFLDNRGTPFFRLEGEVNVGVYYGERKFVCAYREGPAKVIDVKPTVEKIRAMAKVMRQSADEVDRLGDRMLETGDLTYASEVVNAFLSMSVNARLDLMVTRPLRELMR